MWVAWRISATSITNSPIPQTNQDFRENRFIPSGTLTHGSRKSDHSAASASRAASGSARDPPGCEHVEDPVHLLLRVVEVRREADEIAVGPGDDAGRLQVAEQLDRGRTGAV